jgi:hypothetical protein
LTKRLKGKIVSVYLDKITEQRLEALAVEMSVSRSAVLRLLVGQKWQERAGQFLCAVTAFDAAKSKPGSALIQRGVDPATAFALCKDE